MLDVDVMEELFLERLPMLDGELIAELLRERPSSDFELLRERQPSISWSSWKTSSWSGFGRRRCWVETRKEGMEVMLFWSSLREFILLPRQFSTVMSDLDRFLVRFMVRLLMDLCIIVLPVLEWEARRQLAHLYPRTFSLSL